MFYEGNIYRPPSEASSLILQVTVGCKHNQCTFCSMYKGKPYRQKNREEIAEIIEEGVALYPLAKRIFLADGDALTLDTELLVDLLKELYARFPRLERVGIYGGPLDILAKSSAELTLLRQYGLQIVYLGIESGSAVVLKQIKKGVTPQEMITAGQRIVASGILLSCTVISGLGGTEYTKEHALETAKVVNAIDPQYFGTLTLILEPEAPLRRQVAAGTFKLLNPWETLEELKLMIQHLDVHNCVYRSNHASNYLTLKAHLPEEKDALLATLTNVLEQNRDELLRPETWRGL
ncbi:radical SAM protein [Desulfitobacterium sp.]|uniref:radical SAM protein n=1 Tax=Desulfitobacterium sp. TaxID=49981 RepID=UPI002B6B3A5E|nr:radical SAM protein [Desulfitobacterium sp.]HVJ49673.1 radical SAM protein [Desulfitobacterium sp.]